MSAQAHKIGKRAESRLRVRMPARLIALDFNLAAILCDLSKSGARIESAGAPLKCRDVVLTWHDFEAFGQILWSHSGESGIGFYDPIPTQWLIVTRELGLVDHRKHHTERNRLHAHDWTKGLTRL